ncbi:unnamed protein product [Vicia faba]|uniref:Uncharacterized protein n=1 Tax=Vicia faba TaxID=3906 RepID=A0AAV0YTV0_VICFA|nr:unnamed protein product [Vicia faba]
MAVTKLEFSHSNPSVFLTFPNSFQFCNGFAFFSSLSSFLSHKYSNQTLPRNSRPLSILLICSRFRSFRRQRYVFAWQGTEWDEVEKYLSGFTKIKYIHAITNFTDWRKLDVEYEMVGGIDYKHEQHIMKYQRENGLTLWTSSMHKAFTAINASYLQSSVVAKAPHWLNAAISNFKHDFMESSSSGGKE